MQYSSTNISQVHKLRKGYCQSHSQCKFLIIVYVKKLLHLHISKNEYEFLGASCDIYDIFLIEYQYTAWISMIIFFLITIWRDFRFVLPLASSFNELKGRRESEASFYER